MRTELYFIAELKLETALHIGTGKGGEPTDSPLRRTNNGRIMIPGRAIGAIDIRQTETYVDVKEMHVERVLRQMSRSTLRGKPVRITTASASNDFPQRRRPDEYERRKVRKPI